MKRSVVLEIGFRRFVPYNKTEYRLEGSKQRGPKTRLTKSEYRAKVQNGYKYTRVKPLTAERTVIQKRTPVVTLTENGQMKILSTIVSSTQKVADSIILEWQQTQIWQMQGEGGQSLDCEPGIQVRLPKEVKMLYVAACLGENRYHIYEEKNLEYNAQQIRKKCEAFIKFNKGSRSSEIERLYDCVKNSMRCHFIANILRVKINRKYSRQMIDLLLTKVGEIGSDERYLLKQIIEVYKIPLPSEDNELADLFRKYAGEIDELLSIWTLHNYTSLRRLKRLTGGKFSHASDVRSFTVLASKAAQERQMKNYYARKAGEIAKQRDITLSAEEETDADIPF